MTKHRKPIIITDGNQRLSVLESEGERDLKDYPKLSVEHLMGGKPGAVTISGQTVGREIDTVLDRPTRARAVGAGIFKVFLSHPVILYELYLLGEAGWIAKIKETTRPDSLADGLTDAELGLAWDVFVLNIKRVAERGKWRKRRDSRG